jgi:carboxyl-terminal processing protease
VAYHNEVKQYIKATLADQLFGIGAFEEVFNQGDIMIDEVIKMSIEGK